MKKVFSSFLLMFGVPFKLLKKTKIDNFVGGLILGAIFSLLVNVFTVQVQEEIAKQRILEAIESEINLNYFQAKNILETNNKALSNNDPLNYYHQSTDYLSNLWSQSSESLRYITQLDSETQSLIMLYYSVIIKMSNEIVYRVNDIFNAQYVNCFSTDTRFDSSNQDCVYLGRNIRGGENTAAELVQEKSELVLKKFHPTQDRLNSWFLRLMMGDKSVRVLSGK